MENLQANPVITLVLVMVAIIAAFAVLLWLVLGHRSKRLTHELAMVRRELAMIQAGNIGLGKRLLSLSRSSQSIQQQLKDVKETLVKYQAVSQPEKPGRAPKAVKSSAAPTSFTTAQLNQSVPQTNEDDAAQEQFDMAQQMLKGGANLDQVIRKTGLTRSEAELIQLLNKPSLSRLGT